MYEMFKKIKSNPTIMIVLIILVMVLLFGAYRAFSSTATFFGLDTKTNLQTKLTKTNVELDKLVDITKNNKKSAELKEEIGKVTVDTIKNVNSTITKVDVQLALALERLEAMEERISTQEDYVEIRDDMPDDNDLYSLDLLIDRHNKLKGANL